jgi:hypothetical protein
LSGIDGALGGLNFSVTGQRIIFTRDVSGYENANYRQLDTRIYQYVCYRYNYRYWTDKPSGTLDWTRFPSESELILLIHLMMVCQ